MRISSSGNRRGSCPRFFWGIVLACLLLANSPWVQAHPFELKDSSGSLAAFIDTSGNLFLRKDLHRGNSSITPSGSADEWFLKNAPSDTYAKAMVSLGTGSSGGEMWIAGALYNNPSDSHPFKVKNGTDLLASIDSSGNLYIKGDLQRANTRINVGDTANGLTDGAGNYWGPDSYFDSTTCGTIQTSANTITNYNDTAFNAALYQKMRQGNYDGSDGSDYGINYNIPVAVGTYTVRLHFVDWSSSAANSRLIDAVAEGWPLVRYLDIYSVAGGQNKAYVAECTNVGVTDGVLNIRLMGIYGSMSVLCGIEVINTSLGQPAAPAVPTPIPQSTPSYVVTHVQTALTSRPAINFNTGSAPAWKYVVYDNISGFPVQRVSDLGELAALRSSKPKESPSNDIYTALPTDGDPIQGIYNGYSKYPSQSPDGRWALASRTNAQTMSWRLSNPITFMNILAATYANGVGGDDSEVRWDRKTGQSGWVTFLYKGRLKRMNVEGGLASAENLSPVFSGSAVTSGAEDDWDDSGRYFAVYLQGTTQIAVYDRNTNALLSGKISASPNAVDISPSGTWLVIFPGVDSSDPAYQVRFYRISDLAAGNVSSPIPLDSSYKNPDPDPAKFDDRRSVGHNGWALDALGNEVFVYHDNYGDGDSGCGYCDLKYFNPAAQSPASVGVGQLGPEFELWRSGLVPAAGLHIARMSNQSTKGWALMSTYGSGNTTPPTSKLWGGDALLMVELKPHAQNPRIWILGSTQTQVDGYTEKPYFNESFANMSLDGQSIYWGSNWKGTDNLEVYRMQLPPNWWNATALN